MNSIQKLYQESIDSMKAINDQYEREIKLINSGKFGVPRSQRASIISDLMSSIESNIKAIEEIRGFIKEATDL